jgi:nitrogen fixation protein FixH
MATKVERPLTGWHVLAICVGAFGVIIGVNITMAFKAVSTFPGLEVGNSYVASQSFDAERRAQLALGWVLTPSYEDGRLVLGFADASGAAVVPEGLTAMVGRTTEAKDDQTLIFRAEAGAQVADVALAPGKWMLRVEALAPDGTVFRQRVDLFVEPGQGG